MDEFLHHRETRALLDYLFDHGGPEDICLMPGLPSVSYIALEAVDRFFRDKETERGRKAAAAHRMRERIRNALASRERGHCIAQREESAVE